MMLRSLLAVPFPLLMLAACGGAEPAPAPTANTAAAPDGGDAARIAALNPRLRQGVFLRAIRDGGEECQEVTQEYAIGAMQGKPAWAATCDHRTRWLIAIGPDGNAMVTKAPTASGPEPRAS